MKGGGGASSVPPICTMSFDAIVVTIQHTGPGRHFTVPNKVALSWIPVLPEAQLVRFCLYTLSVDEDFPRRFNSRPITSSLSAAAIGEPLSDTRSLPPTRRWPVRVQ
jgi:hypothetical protein